MCNYVLLLLCVFTPASRSPGIDKTSSQPCKGGGLSQRSTQTRATTHRPWTPTLFLQSEPTASNPGSNLPWKCTSMVNRLTTQWSLPSADQGVPRGPLAEKTVLPESNFVTFESGCEQKFPLTACWRRASKNQPGVCDGRPQAKKKRSAQTRFLQITTFTK